MDVKSVYNDVMKGESSRERWGEMFILRDWRPMGTLIADSGSHLTLALISRLTQ